MVPYKVVAFQFEPIKLVVAHTLYPHIALGNGLLSRQIHNSGQYRGENTNNSQCQQRLVYKQALRRAAVPTQTATMGVSSNRLVTLALQAGNPGSSPGIPTIYTFSSAGRVTDS